MNTPFRSSVIGHEEVLDQLEQLLERKTVPHGLLLSGPESVGKRLVARALASALLTNNGNDEKSADKLKLLAAGNHPDFHVCSREEEKKDISVDAVRKLCSDIRLKPYYGSATVSVIDNAHEMSLAAANALLMTLEEPTAESYLILVTHAPQRLPATILSRCQSIHFGELSSEQVGRVLYNLGVPGDVSAGLLELCAGSLEVLELEQFVHPVSLGVTDREQLTAHLRELKNRAEKLTREIDDYVTTCLNQTLNAGAAVSFAGRLAESANESPITWKLLHRTLQRALRTAKRSDTARLANLLELSLAAEKLVRERNVNAQLQLTSLLLEELR